MTPRPTSTSLWPLATEWKSTTGFNPNATTAKAVREGQTRRVVSRIKATVARLAATASQRYVAMTEAVEWVRRAIRPETLVHSGP